ncbi:MAG: hypothetical protein ACI9K2_005852, partial [Myxococcota bacterium]
MDTNPLLAALRTALHDDTLDDAQRSAVEAALAELSRDGAQHTFATVDIGDTAPTETPPELPGIGRYEDLGLLGKGGMGEVRRVRDPVLGRNVAMKIMREQAPRHRFLAEAQLSGMVAHPGVVPV